jgi:S-sulfo-L-cysteine synthase (3-phospho-L-serine-dependent)
MVVGCGFPQLGLLRFCKKQGLFVVGIDRNPHAVGVSSTDAFECVSTTDLSGILGAACRHRIDAITTCGSEAGLHAAAKAADQLSLPFYAKPKSLRAWRGKHDMRARYALGGAPTPAFASVHTTAQASQVAELFGYPLVVKPSIGWGQRGVSVVVKEAELVPAVRAALGADSGLLRTPTCLIEKFIGDREFSVNAYSLDGNFEVLAVTERIITGYPEPPGITFAEVYPPMLKGREQEAVIDAARRGAQALGIERGPTYTQVRLGPEGAVLIETAHRLGGGLDPDVTLLASGVSLYRRIVGCALDNGLWERAGAEDPQHGGAIGRFVVGRPGRVTSVTGLSEALMVPGVVDAAVYVGPGDSVYPLTDGSKRIGHVLATGGGRAEAEANAERAVGQLGIFTEHAA